MYGVIWFAKAKLRTSSTENLPFVDNSKEPFGLSSTSEFSAKSSVISDFDSTAEKMLS